MFWENLNLKSFINNDSTEVHADCLDVLFKNLNDKGLKFVKKMNIKLIGTLQSGVVGFPKLQHYFENPFASFGAKLNNTLGVCLFQTSFAGNFEYFRRTVGEENIIESNQMFVL